MVYTNKMKVVYGTRILGLHGQNFSYLFNYNLHGLESIKINNKEWLYRMPTPTFWRATTDNDRGCGFNIKSAQWLSADIFRKNKDIKLEVDNHCFSTIPDGGKSNVFSNHKFASLVKITFNYETVTIPSTQVALTYTIKANGELKVALHYQGRKNLPSLPVLGIRFIIPTPAIHFDYQGLSGETYPDRMKGAIEGKYHIDGMPVTPHLVPQENGMHMNTQKLFITRNTTQNNTDHILNPFSLKIQQSDLPFNFSLLPYTSEELENATHIEELPLERRAVLVIAGCVRGVGGIDSWGSDVKPQYTISAEKDYDFSVILNAK